MQSLFFFYVLFNIKNLSIFMNFWFQYYMNHRKCGSAIRQIVTLNRKNRKLHTFLFNISNLEILNRKNRDFARLINKVWEELAFNFAHYVLVSVSVVGWKLCPQLQEILQSCPLCLHYGKSFLEFFVDWSAFKDLSLVYFIYTLKEISTVKSLWFVQFFYRFSVQVEILAEKYLTNPQFFLLSKLF